MGQAGVEVRLFPVDPLADAQPRWVSASVKLQPELTLPLGDRVVLRAIARARADDSDPSRSYVDVREARADWHREAVSVSVGINTVFWGVTESRHLVNIVNQTDYLDELDADEKLGQLMALVTYEAGDLGIFELFAMTGARAQLYPSASGRPGVQVTVLDDSPSYESRRGQWNADAAVRWSHGRGNVNWALSYFQGTARDPELVPAGTPVDPAVRPRYDLVRQAGLEIQWTRGSWLWKAESIVREGQGPTFAAITGGFEHTTYGVAGSPLDLGAIIEYSYDGRDNLTFNIHDNDLFGGLRLSFNDVRGSEVLAGVLRDLDSGVTLGKIEASRRLAEGWRVELIGRLFRSDSDDDPVYWFRRDDYVQAALEYYF